MRETIKRLYKPFLLFFCLGLLAANWGDICLVTNYRFLYAFLQENGIIDTSEAGDYFETKNMLIVPNLGLEVPIVIVKNQSPKDFDKALKHGVLHYPFSALPNENGRVVLLGHSAPQGWPKINFDHVFSHLNDLEKNDKFSVVFGDDKYFYKIENKYFLKEGERLPSQEEESSLVLISCWPPGSNQKRIVVEAVLR